MASDGHDQAVADRIGRRVGVEDPLEGYYNGGAGGGQSLFFSKPTWQSSLTGSWRQVPDVAALADPFTGFPIVITEGTSQYGYVYGGTSLASPIFTAVWAIVDQYNGSPLGQAAPGFRKSSLRATSPT